MHATLQKYFGYSSFRPLQEDIINDVLEKKDTFVLMPTGGGKSICYQIPALLMDGITVVVSPLISLMKDQVDSLKENGVDAAYLNSTLSPTQSQKIYQDIESNRIKMLYVAPERLTMTHTLSMLKKINVGLFAIDESHCVSEWGHDFRPEYRRLSILKRRFPDVPIIALTATATPKVRKDTLEQLKMEGCKTYVASFDRKNLLYQVKPKTDAYNQILRYLKKHKDESGIVYCQSRKSVDSIAKKLRKDGFNALPYHAGLSDSQRAKNQEMFIKDKVDIVVATVAFGMGIDKPNVRFVIHYDLPKNLESYYQETGRGGRDGLECECILYFSRGDRYKIEYFIKQKNKKEERDIALKQLREMVSYCESTTCRRKVLLSYFGEETEEDNCGKCDACIQPRETADGTEDAKTIIECIDELGQRFGMTHVIDVLTGANTKKIRDKKHNLLNSYGSGNKYPKARWLEISQEMLHQKVIVVEGARYPLLKLNKSSREVMNGARTVLLTKNVDFDIADECICEEDTNYSANKSRTTPAVKKRRSSSGSDEELLQKLKELRKRMAEMQDVPPYIVFADTSLKQMAAKRPRDKAALLQITGVGEYKLKKYGDIFLKEINGYFEEQSQASTDTEAREKLPPKTRTKVTEKKTTSIKITKIPIKVSESQKEEIILKTIEDLENDIVKMARSKLNDEFSEEEIRSLLTKILSEKRKG
ncbi:DNA helicase RecQ [Methanolobus sp. ZRKC3]|uniref:DNA helicase RecQ n=1 Tax=Methanolobus sp. ZRKC3 TaxID=3125786 RepID=UPI00324F2FD0